MRSTLPADTSSYGKPAPMNRSTFSRVWATGPAAKDATTSISQMNARAEAYRADHDVSLEPQEVYRTIPHLAYAWTR